MKVLMVDDEADIRAVGRLANYYLASDAFAKSARDPGSTIAMNSTVTCNLADCWPLATSRPWLGIFTTTSSSSKTSDLSVLE